ncbi:MAG: tetratricopeptide repeat protein [Desulfosarcina sp.]|nr:tetratricopeptide repeat protein [Desulfosarcina sp.]MBC2744060.1 tetratricopeptide repeat protein [Desulfosarcina sp.]MBC2766969.1 tetratricopeptide repeat protein [Desulfosarcina sp.]
MHADAVDSLRHGIPFPLIFLLVVEAVLDISQTLFFHCVPRSTLTLNISLLLTVIAAAERAVEMEPNNAMAHYMLANVMIFAGKPEKALISIRKAIRLCPYPPNYFLSIVADANYLTERYEAANIAPE